MIYELLKAAVAKKMRSPLQEPVNNPSAPIETGTQSYMQKDQKPVGMKQLLMRFHQRRKK